VLGPWVNGLKTNLFTGTVVALLVGLSVILTASVLDPRISAGQILAILASCAGAAVLGAGGVAAWRVRPGAPAPEPVDRAGRENWRMPGLALLTRPEVPPARRIGLAVLRSYLAVATVLVIVKITELALAH
jgi:hypothetical protein